MELLKGYQSLEVVSSHQYSTLYKGFSISTRRTVLIKTINDNYITSKLIDSIHHEWKLTNSLKDNELLCPIAREEDEYNPLVLYEYFPCMTLREYMLNSGKIELKNFLTIAIKITSGLVNLSQHQIVHKNINPSTILINPSSSDLKLTGLQYAQKMGVENHSYLNLEETDIELAYISPEQTERINRKVDARSDLYSIGVIFYEMLSGHLPFVEKTRFDLIHAHITKQPPILAEMNQSIPRNLSNIIMKLLSKSPIDRYRSPYGLREDLLICQRLLEDNFLPIFEVGKKDPYLNIESINNRLYGRKVEAEKLASICRNLEVGKSQLVFITGESGTGKSALVDEVKQQFTKEQAFFIKGKFDLLIKHSPYSAFIDAFKLLIKQILTEDETIIQQWSERIENEIGSNLAAILNVLPEMKWLVEKEIDQTVITSENAQTHFYYCFQKLVRVFAQQNRPLILFLDDLQWADTASLGLLEYLLSNHDTHSLLVIGAYRQSEVLENHKLTQTILNIEKEVTIYTISLQLLPERTIQEWLTAYFLENVEGVTTLASTIYRITQGNPFFIKQILRSFFEKRILYFDQVRGTWKMDAKKLVEATFQDNVVIYLINRIKQLPEITQSLLKFAACIGNEFELQMLSELSNQNEDETSLIIQDAVEIGLLISLNKSENSTKQSLDLKSSPKLYRFIHDRVQQTIYSTLAEHERASIHLKIGKRLSQESSKLTDSNLVDTVYHLNIARDHLQREERINLASLNVDTGMFSIQTAAFQAALSYFTIAYDLLGDEWENHYDLTFKLFKGWGEAQYVNSQFSQSEGTFNTLIEQAKTKEEQFLIYHLKITLYTHQHRVEEAVDAGMSVLQLFNQNFTRNPSKLQVAKEIFLVKLALFGKKPRDILNLAEIDSEENRLIIKMLISLNGPSFHVDQNLAAIFMLKAMRMTIQHGLTEMSPLVFNNFALILSSGLNDYKLSYEFGKLALSYAEGKCDVAITGRVYFVFASFVNHWKNHLKENITYFEKSQKHCIQAGNMHLAGANSSFIVISHFLKGSRLEILKGVIQAQKSFIEEIQYPISAGFMSEMQEWIDYLTNEKTKEWTFNKIIDDDSAKIIHYTIRLKMAYLFDKDHFAAKVLQELSPIVTKRLTLVIAPEFFFFEALCMLKLAREKNYKLFSKKELYKKIKRDLRQLETYASMSPINYQSKKMLVMAELAAITGDKVKAEHCFEEAIKSSEKYQFLHTIAICQEAAGRYYADQKRHNIAGVYLKEAYNSYLNWGAKKKAQQLLIKYETYTNLNERKLPEGYDQHAEQYDLNAVYKAAQIISSEMNIQKLLEKVLHITMEHAGATKGTILFKEDDVLSIAVQTNTESQSEVDFSNNIVKYVNRTGEIVHLDHACAIGIFKKDDYVVRTNAKSIICLPIYLNHKLVGILYLENDKVSHVFTKERFKLIMLLITQAAISIENALLYKHMEDKVNQRTIELEQVNQTLAETNHNLAQSEEMRRELLSNISHDLRAPIASVQGYMEAILDGFAQTEEKRNEFIRNSILRIKGLNVLINDLFDLTQLEAGNISFSFDYVPIDQLLENIKKQFLHEVTSKNLTLELLLIKGSQQIFPLVEIDIERIGQVFANLLTNAIKHTTVGGIQLQLEIEEETVLIICRDTGLGIHTEDLPYIFEKNYTKSIHSTKKGHGLGLSICKEIIKRHNGEIWAESKPGVGTTIFIHLPIVRIEEELMLL